MQFSAIFLSTLLHSLAAASPIEARNVQSMMATGSAWTIEKMTRNCNAADTACNWSFSVNINDGSVPTAFAYTVNNAGATPASQSPETGITIGRFTVTSGWSGQFGPGNGFTTLSVVDNPLRLIAYPAYTDVELAGGKTVSPDKSYTPQNLP